MGLTGGQRGSGDCCECWLDCLAARPQLKLGPAQLTAPRAVRFSRPATEAIKVRSPKRESNRVSGCFTGLIRWRRPQAQGPDQRDAASHNGSGELRVEASQGRPTVGTSIRRCEEAQHSTTARAPVERRERSGDGPRIEKWRSEQLRYGPGPRRRGESCKGA